MSLGLKQLRLSPDTFWKLSLPEWRALIDTVSPAMARGDLETLMKLYPDGQ
jgi:uncharacterized phage protein (TIGR02216 family)